METPRSDALKAAISAYRRERWSLKSPWWDFFGSYLSPGYVDAGSDRQAIETNLTNALLGYLEKPGASQEDRVSLRVKKMAPAVYEAAIRKLERA